MENQKKNNKTYLLITLGVIGTIMLTLGITYAYWRLTKEQTNENVVTTACLDVDIESQQDDINLPKAYPISDEDAESLVPFKFIIHNKCEDNASFQINLESMNRKEILETQRLNPKYLKFKLNEVEQNGITRLLTGNKEEDTTKVMPTITNAYDAHKLMSGYIEPNGSKSFEFRLWMDGEITAEEVESMNKTFVSKISVTSTYLEEDKIPPKVQFPGKEIPLAQEGQDGLYAVEHNDLNELGSEWNKTEYRYAGVDPDNYVLFNNEKWRIIGLVNVKTESGVEQRVKIIRTDGIEEQKNFGEYAWDRDENYTNNWTTSKLKDMLNGIYYNSGKGECYIWQDYSMTQSECDFSGEGEYPKGLDDTARRMIDSEVIWNLGGWDVSEGVTKKMYYERERGTITGSGNTYPTEWTKENDETYHKGVGLMYASDYIYATHGGTIGREGCFKTNSWKFNDPQTECANNDWLKPVRAGWILVPESNKSSNAYYLETTGDIDDYQYSTFTNMPDDVWPVVYLSPSVTIYDGDGSIGNPFKLSVQ